MTPNHGATLCFQACIEYKPGTEDLQCGLTLRALLPVVFRRWRIACRHVSSSLSPVSGSPNREPDLTRDRDLPRPGGYEALRYQRNLPTKGPSGLALFGGMGLVCAFGWYKWAQGRFTEQ